MPFDPTKTLEELESDVWKAPEEGDFVSHLVARCHALRKIPLSQMTPGDLRILIGQNIGLEFLVPLALEILERKPLIKADFYPGDLLGYVLGRDNIFWREHPEWQERAQRVFAHAERLSRPGSSGLDAEDVLKELKARCF